MYVRDAKNREEVWLLDHIEAMGLDETAFRSRDYVVAIDEESGEKAGFGRIRVHKPNDSDDVCELTSIGVLENWRGQGVGAHVIERLVEYAGDEGFDTVYALTGEGPYLAQFGFQRISESDLPTVLQDRLDAKRDGSDPDAVPLSIDVDEFRMPARLREAFKRAPEGREDADSEESPEDFGIDPDSATYKYDTGR
ncbi:GNAT family N-acetyltransferase [Natrinema hispanicum]|uniref:N-acetylglutamate synthase, GNAT family n=1 Tax=Natrinema hispanicum TaxID=392421 RepID=A0A1G6PVB0_9EURY|nr:GNAT family N-acetyltransferase [Natrinema hispanicum]SDC84150.1 N-acetylglutamate synthase, GNAT family [Natrinema hispanicum]SET33138.1 N-acetylglutamate synthase, GNAT family [Natrinema hispanicum]